MSTFAMGLGNFLALQEIGDFWQFGITSNGYEPLVDHKLVDVLPRAILAKENSAFFQVAIWNLFSCKRNLFSDQFLT